MLYECPSKGEGLGRMSNPRSAQVRCQVTRHNVIDAHGNEMTQKGAQGRPGSRETVRIANGAGERGMHRPIGEIPVKRYMASAQRSYLRGSNGFTSDSQSGLCPAPPVTGLGAMEKCLDALNDSCVGQSRRIMLGGVKYLWQETIGGDSWIIVKVIDDTPAGRSR